jgi:hypothetical protein
MNANQTELTNAVETEAASSVPSAVKKIIVAVGLSAHSEATARYAARWAEVFAASLNLVHVCPLELVDGFGISPEPVTALRLHGGSAQEALSVLAQRHPGILSELPSDSPGRGPGRGGDFARPGPQRRPDRYRQPPSSRIPGSLVCSGPRAQDDSPGTCPVLIYQGPPYEGEVAPADDSWRKPLPAQEIYLPH